MKLYTIYGDYIIENFTQTTDDLNIFTEAISQIILLLYNKEPIPYDLFNTFSLLIKKISLEQAQKQYTAKQTEIEYHLSLFNEKSIPSSLFISYIEHVLPIMILPEYIILYKELIKQIRQEIFLPHHIIINSIKLNSLIMEINNVT